MNTKLYHSPRFGCWHLFLLLLLPLPGALFGQSASPVAPPTTESSPRKDEVIELTTFTVTEESDQSYGALNSNSVTRFNVPLNQLPVTADIFTQAFMDDVGATSIEEVVSKYSAGGGFSASDPSADAANGQAGDRTASSSVTVRGLMSPTLRRDGFIQLGSLTNPGSTGSGLSSNFDVERVEVIDGPQSLLYGSGGAGGVVNTISKQARFGKAPFGSVRFKVDEHGHQGGQLDFGVGNSKLALRLSILDEEVGNRRVNIGGPLKGYYLQVAAKLGNTIVRLTGGQTTFYREYNAGLTFTAASAANDGRNGQNLKYLLASDQIEKSATGNSGAGVLGGNIDWNNVDSYAGWHRSERSKNEYLIGTAETRWSNWLTSELSVGYNNFEDILKSSGGGAFVAPNVTANTTHEWASATGGASIFKPTRTSAARFALAADHSLFGGHAKTMVGVDYSRSRQTSINLNLYKADANWNVIGSEATRVVMPTQYFPITNGPVEKALFDPYSKHVTINGVNYVQDVVNPPSAARISPENPLGVTLGGSVYQVTTMEAKGAYLVNMTQWMHDRLTTLVGARFNDSTLDRDWASPAGSLLAASKEVDFNLGANYAVRDWLRPYFGLSSSFNPPLEQGIGPDGIQVKTSKAVGGEVGVKVQNASSHLSGSVAWFYLDSKDETQRIANTYIEQINPSGLNGQNGAAANWANVSRKSQGVQASFTYAPTRNWRTRLAAALTDGTVGTTKVYDQFYNDQFYANAGGQITYRDGTPVYVPPVASATTPVVSATTPGAVPLTLAMLNSSTSVYFANPAAISGAISSTSAVARVLGSVDATHGPILTGATGLPISAMQINPGFTPPGQIMTSAAGDVTTGYSKYSLNLTSTYTLSKGWLSGLRFGGTVALGWENRGFYYFPNGVAAGTRDVFLFPDVRRFDGIVAYEHKFHAFTWGIQLNVSNVFNRYEVVVLPNPTTGWAGVKNAVYSTEPRAYILSSTIKF